MTLLSSKMEKGAVALEDADALLAEPSAEVHFKQQYRRQKLSLIVLGLFVTVLIGVAVSIAVVTNKPIPVGRLYDFNDVFDSANQPNRKSVRWITNSAGTDGLSTFEVNKNIFVQELPVDPFLLVNASLVNVPGGFDFFDYWISPDGLKVLYGTNYQKVWRHSYTADYYFFTVDANGGGTPAPVDSNLGPIQYAVWSPDSNTVAYVQNNDIYIINTSNRVTTRVTNDNSAAIVNGVPSWVYEEEVFGTNFALWWSESGDQIAFVKYDETDVETFTYPIYNKDQYPEQINVKYPKAGTTNPKASLWVYTVATETARDVSLLNSDFLGPEFYMVDISWVSEELLLVRFVARLQELAELRLVPVDGSATILLNQYNTNGEGWLDYPAARPIPNNRVLDLDTDPVTGYVHLFVIDYTIPTAVSVTQLTPFADEANQDYEVLSIAGYNVASDSAYLLTTHRGPMERHVYEVAVGTPAAPVALTEGEGYYGVSFSPNGGFYLLNYDGPDVPRQDMFQRNGNASVLLKVVESNDALRERVAGLALPTYVYSTVNYTVDGVEYEVNVLELHPPPPLFDPYAYDSYPMLLRVYGGPSSQLVLKRFTLDWHTYMACSHNYVVVMADVRGTGARGSKFRNHVYRQLGKVEAADQTEVARQIVAKGYVDPARVSVWGWSYGGYLTSKIIENDNSSVFEAAVAVAPVSDWRYYDTIYTERYMLTTEANAAGYAESAVHPSPNFANSRYMLIHGTADDNVHYQNGAVLAAELVDAGLPFEMVAYTDNDHRINTGANTQRDLYGRITKFLLAGGEEDTEA